MMIDLIPGGVTAAKGFKAACCAAGIKYKDRTDMAMLLSERPCAVAGTFTTNVVKAAPVLWDRRIVYDVKSARAVVVNAGIANAATGEAGMDLCRKSADCAAAETYFQQHYPQFQVARSSDILLEIMDGKVSKAAGIEVMLKAYGFDKSEALSLGDNYNDLAMLKYTGMGLLHVM